MSIVASHSDQPVLINPMSACIYILRRADGSY
jgi:hypothetical protein